MTTTNKPAATTTTTPDAKIDLAHEGATEWVAVLHGNTGTVKIAYRNPRALAVGLAEQTREGWVAAHVYERQRRTYAE